MTQAVGRLESINKGDTFYNINVLLEDKTIINLKITNKHFTNLKIGVVYFFRFKEAQIQKKDNLKKFFVLEEVVLLEKHVKNIEVLDKYVHLFFDTKVTSLVNIKEEIEVFLASIKNTTLKKIVKTIYQKDIWAFYLYPAARKMHHAFAGGLAFHTLTILKNVAALAKVYPFLNKDLLYAGALLHDFCKIREYQYIDSSKTLEGNLLGHISMIALDIEKTAVALKVDHKEEVILLKHMVLSHHGLLHFGSPVKPQLAEALMLWYADTIDSKMAELNYVLAQTTNQTFTENIAVIDKTKFYKHNLSK